MTKSDLETLRNKCDLALESLAAGEPEKAQSKVAEIRHLATVIAGSDNKPKK